MELCEKCKYLATKYQSGRKLIFPRFVGNIFIGGFWVYLLDNELPECFIFAAGDVAVAPLGGAAAGAAFVVAEDFSRLRVA